MFPTIKQSFIALTVAASLALVGCSNNAANEPAGGETPTAANTSTAKKFTIGMSQCNLGEPYRAQMNKDIEEAAKAHPELTIVYKDAENDALKQRGHVEEFVQDKVDLLIISPKEAQPLTEPIAKAMDAGIPVIVLDRAIMGDKFTCFIGGDNKAIGLAAGKWLASKLPNGGNIVELKGLMTSTPAVDRHNGFIEGMKGNPAKIAFEADTKWLEPNARKEMESALARVPKIDAVFAHNDPGAHGAYLAAQAAKRDKEMMFIGIDALPQEGRAYVEQGILAASFEYPTGGKDAIETALKILNKQPFEKNITLASKFFTPENVKSGGEPIK